MEWADPFDEPTLSDVLELDGAARAVDEPHLPPPTPTATRAFRRYGWDGEPDQEWLCRDDDGRPVGKLTANLPQRDNRHAVFARVVVHPQHRRRGIGRLLAARLPELASGAGRRVLISDSLDVPASRAFGEELGFTVAGVDIDRRQDLRTVDWEQAGRLRAQAREAAHGYALVPLPAPVPEDIVEDVARMEAAINDAPKDDVDREDEAITAERIRAREHSLAAAGLREHRLVARRDRDGALAGHTVVHVDPEQPRYGGQGDTSVLAAHRGHHLGMWLKSEMMFRIAAAEPQLRWVDTGNAESNRHMIAINEALGYEIVTRWLQWQRNLTG